MNHVAFFRNLNLGRPHCPDRRQFENAFLDAGASAAASFLTNGTMVFQADDGAAARQIVQLACSAMQLSCGLREPAFLRKLSYLEQLVGSTPFAAVDRDSVYDCYATFLHTNASVSLPIPHSTKRGDVEVVGFTGSEAFCIARMLTKSPGSPNAFLEKTLKFPATTRAWNTVVRLVAKYT